MVDVVVGAGYPSVALHLNNLLPYLGRSQNEREMNYILFLGSFYWSPKKHNLLLVRSWWLLLLMYVAGMLLPIPLLVSVKVASDFGVVFGQVCICRLCQNPTNAVKSAAVLNRLDYFLRTYFGHFRLINWWHWHGPQKAQQRGKETLLLQKLFFIIISVICLIYKKFHKR